MRAVYACATALVLLHGPAPAAQIRPGGYASLTVDALPNAPAPSTELRARLFLEQRLRPLERLTIHVAGFVEGLLADRDRGGAVRDALVRPQEAYVEIAAPHSSFRIGYSRVVWGRLDEIQPTDVVNPLDLARFVFEGRAEARLPVALARGRVFFGERASLDGVVVFDFRRGRFDQLDEPSSPFNLAARGTPVAIDIVEPATSWRNLQGGGRFTATVGRVDWSVSAYRGFPGSGLAVLPAGSGPAPDLTPATAFPGPPPFFPRFTMIGGDFETAAGEWGLRGEVAVTRGPAPRIIDGGVGFDRGAGKYRLSGTVLVHRETAGPYTSASLVASADRTFARERYRTRTFVAYNMAEGVAFTRNITTVELRDNVALEGSIGWFFGSGPARPRDVITRLAARDFAYARLRVHF